MYVEPVYLEASNQAIPEVKRVIVAYQDKIAYEATLSEALLSLFGGTVDDTSVGSVGEDGGNGAGSGAAESVRSLIKKAQNAYDKAIECQREGDWEGYGKYIGMLEQYLTKLGSASSAGSAGTASADAGQEAAEDTAETAETAGEAE
jgi:uncharacterized membrane protein (UPF0182 family)